MWTVPHWMSRTITFFSDLEKKSKKTWTFWEQGLILFIAINSKLKFLVGYYLYESQVAWTVRRWQKKCQRKGRYHAKLHSKRIIMCKYQNPLARNSREIAIYICAKLVCQKIIKNKFITFLFFIRVSKFWYPHISKLLY